MYFLSGKMNFRGCLFILYSNAFSLSLSPSPLSLMKNCFIPHCLFAFRQLFLFWVIFLKQFSISIFLRWSFSSRCAWIFHPFYYLIFDYHLCTLDSQSGLIYYITSDWRLNTKGSTYWWKPENASTFSSVKNFKTYLEQFFRFIASKWKLLHNEIKIIHFFIDFHFWGKTLSSGRLEIPTTF